MHPLRIRLSDEDRTEYGGDEWLPIHAGLFVERRASALKDWEQQTGVKLLDLLDGSVDVKTVEFPVIVAWLARQLAGLTEPAYEDFDPHILAIQLEPLILKPEGDDVDPPARSSADTSAETSSPDKLAASRSRRGSKR